MRWPFAPPQLRTDFASSRDSSFIATIPYRGSTEARVFAERKLEKEDEKPNLYINGDIVIT